VNDHPPFREDGRDWIVPGQNRPENIEGQTGGGPVEERLAVRLRADITRQGAAPPPIRLAFVPKPDRSAQRVGKQSVVGRRHTLATPETGSEA
jgi:hypothetical protein